MQHRTPVASNLHRLTALQKGTFSESETKEDFSLAWLQILTMSVLQCIRWAHQSLHKAAEMVLTIMALGVLSELSWE